MCRTVRDAARYVDAIAGPTNNDPTSLPRPVRSYEDAVVSGDAAGQLRGKRAVWSSTLGFAVCDPEVEELSYEAALALCADAGIELVDIDVNFPRPGGAWALISNLDTAADYLDAAREHWDDVTPVSRAGLQAVDGLNAETMMRGLRRRFELLIAIGAVFDQVDLMLTPTTATTAFVAEGPPPLEIGGQKVGGMGSVPYTAPFNISGMPGVSIPCGFASDELPVGLQVVGRRDDEEAVLGCGAIAEANRPWPKFAPLAYS
jgi:aspartyl-tRNA(Asn)/glutamyl-tRNA(Gln) amidotransferase subunit A